jgi:NPCBM/NEW2 domain
MQRERALIWTVTGSVVAVAAVVTALILVNSGTPPTAASPPATSISATASSPAGKPVPMVIPKTSGTSSFSYLADLNPSGNLGELVNAGPVKIDGSIYPKSISFYCNVGDPTAFPAYRLGHNSRRFQATIGLAAKFPPNFEAGIILIGDGRTLRTFSVGAPKPKTVDVNVTGIHTLQLECFGSGQSSSAGWAIAVAWGNARVTERH